jgi:hypothetical protein
MLCFHSPVNGSVWNSIYNWTFLEPFPSFKARIHGISLAHYEQHKKTQTSVQKYLTILSPIFDKTSAPFPRKKHAVTKWV